MAQQNKPGKTYPASKARQGETVLRKPWQRAIFIAGVAGAALIGFAAGFLAL